MPWIYAIEGKSQLAVRRENGPPWEERLKPGEQIAGRDVLAEIEVPKEIANAIDDAPRWHRILDGRLERTTDEGATWEAVSISPIVLPVPESVFMFQLRKAMRRTAVIAEYPEGPDALTALEDYARNANDPDLADELAAPSVRRDHGTVEKLRRLFQWSHEQVDDLFRLSETQ